MTGDSAESNEPLKSSASMEIKSGRWSHQSNVSLAPCLTAVPNTPVSTDPLNWLSAGTATKASWQQCYFRAEITPVWLDRDGQRPCHRSPLEGKKKHSETTLLLCSREQPFVHDSSQIQMWDECVVTAANKVSVICWSVCQCVHLCVSVCMRKCPFVVYVYPKNMLWTGALMRDKQSHESCVLIHDYMIHIWHVWSSLLDRLKSQWTKIVSRSTKSLQIAGASHKMHWTE